MPVPASLPPGVHKITLPTPFAIGAVNTYLLDGDPLTLVDPGPRVPEARAGLEEGLAEHGRRVEDVELVLLTHQHHDHVGLAEEVRERSGARVAAIDPLAVFLADFDAAMDADDAYAVATMHRHGVEPETAARLDALSRRWRSVGGGVPVDLVVAEGDVVRAGGRDLLVHRRPGHSPTDTVFHDPRDGLLIGGDHLLEHVSSNPVVHCPIGEPDPAGAPAGAGRPQPLVDYLASFRLTRDQDVSVVAPGHGVPFTGHRELIAQRESMHRTRAERILDRVRGDVTAADIAREMWGRIPMSQAFLALSEVLGHVDLLAGEGRVREVVDGDLVRLERT